MLALLIVAQIGVVIGIINIGVQMTLYVSDSKDKAKSNRVLYSIILLLVAIIFMNIVDALV